MAAFVAFDAHEASDAIAPSAALCGSNGIARARAAPTLPDPAWRDARHVLCVRMASLGGVLRCTPALRALRKGAAGRRLTLLTSTSGAAVAPFVPDIDDVIACDGAWMHDGQADDADAAPFVAHLRARRFDAAVVFTGLTESASPAVRLLGLAGIPLRLAYADPASSSDAPGDPHGLPAAARPDDPEPAHTVLHDVVRQLALVRPVAGPPDAAGLSFVPRPVDVDRARAALLGLGLAPGQPFLLLHPGGRAAARRYPAAHWAEAAAGLARATDLPLVFTGTGAERGLVDAIRAGCGVPTHSLAGALDLGQLGAAIGMAALLVCGNTAPAHIAAAVGTPLVALYALTHPQCTPWRVRSRVLFHDVPCRFCFGATCPARHHACLANVRPQAVVEAAIGLLDAVSTTR